MGEGRDAETEGETKGAAAGATNEEGGEDAEVVAAYQDRQVEGCGSRQSFLRTTVLECTASVGKRNGHLLLALRSDYTGCPQHPNAYQYRSSYDGFERPSVYESIGLCYRQLFLNKSITPTKMFVVSCYSSHGS